MELLKISSGSPCMWFIETEQVLTIEALEPFLSLLSAQDVIYTLSGNYRVGEIDGF